MRDAFVMLLSTCSAALGSFVLRDYQLRALAALSERIHMGSLAILLCSSTGSGKTLAFVLPAVALMLKGKLSSNNKKQGKNIKIL